MKLHTKNELKLDSAKIADTMGSIKNKGKRKRHVKMLEKTLRNPNDTMKFVEEVATYSNQLRFYKDIEIMKSFYKCGIQRET